MTSWKVNVKDELDYSIENLNKAEIQYDESQEYVDQRNRSMMILMWWMCVWCQSQQFEKT